MTKKQLIDALADYPDDQYICVLMTTNEDGPFRKLGWKRNQIFIHGLQEYPPWHGDHKLLGIVVHESNGKPEIIENEKYISFDSP